MFEPQPATGLLELVKNCLDALDTPVIWSLSDTEKFLTSGPFIKPAEIITLYESGQTQDVRNKIEEAYWLIQSLEEYFEEETPEFYHSDIKASETEKQLWLELKESLCRVQKLSRVETFEIFMSELRKSSPAPYVGDVQSGEIDPKVLNLVRHLDTGEKDYVCSTISSKFTIGEQLVAIERLNSVGGKWERLIDSSYPDFWTEAVLNGYISTKIEVERFKELELNCHESPARFAGICSTLFEICEGMTDNKGKQTFITGVKAAIARADIRQALADKSIRTKDDLTAWISSIPVKRKQL